MKVLLTLRAYKAYEAELNHLLMKELCELMTTPKDKAKPKSKKLAKSSTLAKGTDRVTNILIQAHDHLNEDIARDDSDVLGYCKEWWTKYGETVPVAYSSMMRRLPNRLRLRSRLLDSLARLTAAGSLYFKHSFLTKNMVYHPSHIPVFGSEEIHAADMVPRELK